MKPNEILKGLQCCTSSEDDCNSCPLIEKKQVEGGCGHFLMENAFEYINQLEAENMELKSDVITLKHSNEYLKNKYDEIMSLSKRIMQKLIKAHKRLKTTKLEAVKEYEERLKEKKCHYTETEHTFDFDGVTVEDIDNLAKEMGVK